MNRKKRKKLHPKKVAQYECDFECGDDFPPIEVEDCGTFYTIRDGRHRYIAQQNLGYTMIDVVVVRGGRVAPQVKDARDFPPLLYLVLRAANYFVFVYFYYIIIIATSTKGDTMSKGDTHQLAHQVPQALVARLAAVKGGSQDWKEHHQLGVLFSELAESAYRIGDPGWRGQACILLDRAFDCFQAAIRLIPADEHVGAYALSCDVRLAQARLDRTTNMGELLSTQANTGLCSLGRDLELASHANHPGALHQLAIIYGFLARLASGRWGGFDSEPNRRLFYQRQRNANDTFVQDNLQSPDSQQAYRSHLLAMALIHANAIHPVAQWAYATRALWSACRHQDWGHAKRALLILVAGNRGERWLRKQRDSNVIHAACHGLL